MRRSQEAMIRKWHEAVEEFCREMGINETNAHQVQLLQRDLPEVTAGTETSIEFNGKIIGVITTAMTHAAAGLKFTITCQKVVQPL
jgi:hypothetical protein